MTMRYTINGTHAHNCSDYSMQLNASRIKVLQAQDDLQRATAHKTNVARKTCYFCCAFSIKKVHGSSWLFLIMLLRFTLDLVYAFNIHDTHQHILLKTKFSVKLFLTWNGSLVLQCLDNAKK
ncbi:hypothetical protein ACJX0J_011204 [Zea mays]